MSSGKNRLIIHAGWEHLQASSTGLCRKVCSKLCLPTKNYTGSYIFTLNWISNCPHRSLSPASPRPLPICLNSPSSLWTAGLCSLVYPSENWRQCLLMWYKRVALCLQTKRAGEATRTRKDQSTKKTKMKGKAGGAEDECAGEEGREELEEFQLPNCCQASWET